MKSNLKLALLAGALSLPFSGTAFATTVPVGADFPASISVPEDGGTHVIDYTLTNNTAGPITINSAAFVGGFLSGDASDGLSNLQPSFTGCGSVAAGGTCTAHLSVRPKTF